MKGLKIPRYKSVSTKTPLDIYNKPERVYIPTYNATVLVNKGDYVCKGSIIGKVKDNVKKLILSTVSGKVIDFEDHTIFNGNKVKCIVIENDFKETNVNNLKKQDKINEITKQEFIEILKNNGIVGLGGSGFPTYIKYNNENINTLIVNAVECEPYITADYFIIKDKCQEILEVIDAIMEINNINESIIAVSSKSLLDIINKYIGTYLKIKVVLVPSLYPMGWERNLIKELTNITYDKLPIEKYIIVNNISTIYAIYQALKLNKPLTERIVTFSGNGLKNSKNILVKIGTPVKELINYIGCDNKILIAGGPMMGENVEDLIVTPELNCVLILKNIKKEEVKNCLRCGKCVSVCPAKICPVLIKDNINNIEKLKQLNANKCINCGLCSYICPAKINVRESVRKAKEKVGK